LGQELRNELRKEFGPLLNAAELIG